MSKLGMSPGGPSREQKVSELRKRFNWLDSFTDNELKDISYCQEHIDNSGKEVKLRENELYFDLNHPEKGIIRGRAHETIPEGSCYVSKSQTNPETWQKLTKPFSED